MKRNKETEQKKQAAGNYPDFEVRTDLAVEGAGAVSREMEGKSPVFPCGNGGSAIQISV